jgi:hypothetical protein
MIFTIHDHTLSACITDYVEGNMDTIESTVFEELIKFDKTVEYEVGLALNCRNMINNLPEIKARPGFEERLSVRLLMEMANEQINKEKFNHLTSHDMIG